MVASGERLIGVDVGGSTIKAAVVDLATGNTEDDPVHVDTPDPATPDAIVAAIADLVAGLDAHGPIGCTYPGRVRGGIVRSAVNMDSAWLDQRPEQLLGDALGRSVHVLNDADAAGLAEMTYGAGRERRGVVVVVTLGTGIGSALFVDRTLVPNTELGELDVDGQRADELASRAAREEKGLSWEEWAVDVGRYLQRVQDVVDPELIIVGGGASEHPDRLWPALSQSCDVTTATLGNAAGIVGAALHACACNDERAG